MSEQRKKQFIDWADAVDVVSRSNSFTDDQVINTWPDDVKRHYPELTVGAVRYADHCANNHEKLVEALGKMHAIAEFRESRNHEVIAAGELLAALEAEKGGGV